MKLNDIIKKELFEEIILYFNKNLRDDKDAKWWVFDEIGFGTDNTITLASGSVDGKSEAYVWIPITKRMNKVTAIGLKTAQFVVSEFLSLPSPHLGRSVISLVSALERNYQTP